MVKEKVVKDTTDRWLLTYADLMNLLLIFFIVLYALSKIDQGKFEQLSAAFRQEYGIVTPGTSPSNTYIAPGPGGEKVLPSSSIIPSTLEQQQVDKVTEGVTGIIKKQNLGDDVNISLEERGLVISFRAKLLFKSGSAELEPNSKPTIEEIGQVLKAVPSNQIRVEGNTDNDPIRNSVYASNWELSSARATNVLRLLVDKSGLDPTRISAVGYGEYRPKVMNDTEGHKAENRRVDIVIVRSKFDQAEPGAPGNP